MNRFFNTAGPCEPRKHYTLPSQRRLPSLRPLIDQEAYFVIHAPRQSGKTTAFHHLARELTADGCYAALLISCETGATARDDVESGVNAVIEAISEDAGLADLPESLRPPELGEVASISAETRLKAYLTRWCMRCPRPVVLFMDEIDALIGQTLLSVLHQLRAGYRSRPHSFPHSLALIGLRDVRDYKIPRTTPDGTREILGTSSPFNIKVESLTLRNFNAEEVAELYRQHTEETGQRFTDEAVARAYDLSRGQPWLVNALARQSVVYEAPNLETVVTREIVDAAKEALILRRDTHLDSLVERLREPRVQRILEPILAGEALSENVLDDDLVFVKALGLVASSSQGLQIANPIYREIIPRALTTIMEESLVLPRPSYLNAAGGLDFERLLDDFRAFWIEHGEPFLRKAPYSEAATQLVFMAFLHKVVNGKGGSIDREYAAGTGRLDLCVRWPLTDGGVQRHAVELKVWRDTTPQGRGILTPVEKGLVQLTDYLESLGLDRGTLIVFDARSDAEPLPDRVSRETSEHDGRTITLWRF